MTHRHHRQSDGIRDLMIRRTWEELPLRLRREVTRLCGRVIDVDHASAGRNSQFAATLKLAHGRVFVKGVMEEQAPAYRHEAAVNKVLPSCAPRLLWQVEMCGWFVLGFEHVDGRHADMSPGSADLPMIARTLGWGTADGIPGIADQWARLGAWRRLRATPPADLHPWSRRNIDRFVEYEHAATELMAGNTLVHTDLQTLNILIDPRVRIVDWAWARVGAPWTDVALLVPRLIEAGHTPAEAELWAESVPEWAGIPETTKTAFAMAVLGVWEYLQRRSPLPHRARLADVAREWARHREPTGRAIGQR